MTRFPKKGLSGISQFSDQINSAAATYGIDPNLLSAVIKAESSGNPNAQSSAGAQGLMQLMPATAASLGVTNSFDPTQNINAGAQYLSQLFNQFGNWPEALAAYNWGPGNVATYTDDSWPTETQNYVSGILNSLGGSVAAATTSLDPSDSNVSNLSDSSMMDLTVGIGALVAGFLIWRFV